jgi:uncharacterized membrane protein YfcA
MAALVLVLLGGVSLGTWLGAWRRMSQREQRVMLGCLGTIFLVALLLWLWVRSLPSPASP